MKNIKISIILIFFSLIINDLRAAGKFEFTPLARKAYDKTLALKFDEAVDLIGQLRKTDPNNLITIYIENHLECIKIFINEDKSEYDKFAGNEKKRLNILKNGDAQSPYYLFTQAQVQLFWAMNKIKFGNYLDALNAASTSYELLEKNQQKFPAFIANKMTLGVLHAVVGTIPDKYKWGAKLMFGMNGTIQQGQSEIEEVINYAKTNDFVFESEAMVMYAFLMLHLNNRSESAWNIMNTGKLKPRENMLHCFALANVAMRTGRNDKAIEILQNRPVGNGYHPVYYLDYMLGLAKLYRGDSDADEYLKKYVYYFKGRNYIKEGFQRIAWFELLRDNREGYKIFIENCKTAGRAEIGGDKNALKEARAGIAPDPTLLRGRLFFDGGYYQKAYEYLKSKNESSFSSQANKLEYTYRMGRVLQMLKKPNEAIQFYDKTIQAGKQTKYYYACNAALQLGIIYEEYKQYDKARQYFNYCLALNPDDYSDSLHTSAKAGLNRLKGKN